MKILLLFLLSAPPVFGQSEPSPPERIYNILRSLHAGEKAATNFTAKLTASSARRILRDKIPGTNWHVAVDYNIYRGLSLKIIGSEPFYENALAQHEQHINEMLLPLLSTRGYERFKDSFMYDQPKAGVIRVSFNKGDILTSYLFQTGENGLVRRLDYYEDGARKYALTVQWIDIENQSVPQNIKAVSYEGSRISGEFQIEEIDIKKN